MIIITRQCSYNAAISACLKCQEFGVLCHKRIEQKGGYRNSELIGVIGSSQNKIGLGLLWAMDRESAQYSESGCEAVQRLNFVTKWEPPLDLKKRWRRCILKIIQVITC